MAGFWRKSLIYLGLVEDDEFDDLREYEEASQGFSERNIASPAPAPAPSRRQRQREIERPAVLQPVSVSQVRMHMIEPKSFNDAEQVGQKFKSDIPVIINLQMADAELAKRLIDFASGLTYGLEGGIQRVADKVFLLTPHNVDVSAEDKKWLREKGFFNQF
jgi:cell division inhibitor SepF